MNPFQGKLKEISGGRLLDVGTSGGDFINILIGELKDYDQAIGIDMDDKHFEKARKEFEGKPVRFLKMDAAAMEFEDESFDTVAMHAAIHHLMEPDSVFKEVRRVLKPGGHIIISEEICDSANKKEMLNIAVHSWHGKIDSLIATPQNPTFRKQMIIDLLKPLRLTQTDIYEFKCRECNPEEPEKLEKLFKSMDDELEKIRDLPEYEALEDEKEQLRKDILTYGYDCPPYLIVIGIK